MGAKRAQRNQSSGAGRRGSGGAGVKKYGQGAAAHEAVSVPGSDASATVRHLHQVVTARGARPPRQKTTTTTGHAPRVSASSGEGRGEKQRVSSPSDQTRGGRSQSTGRSRLAGVKAAGEEYAPAHRRRQPFRRGSRERALIEKIKTIRSITELSEAEFEQVRLAARTTQENPDGTLKLPVVLQELFEHCPLESFGKHSDTSEFDRAQEEWNLAIAQTMRTNKTWNQRLRRLFKKRNSLGNDRAVQAVRRSLSPGAQEIFDGLVTAADARKSPQGVEMVHPGRADGRQQSLGAGGARAPGARSNRVESTSVQRDKWQGARYGSKQRVSRAARTGQARSVSKRRERELSPKSKEDKNKLKRRQKYARKFTKHKKTPEEVREERARRGREVARNARSTALSTKNGYIAPRR